MALSLALVALAAGAATLFAAPDVRAEPRSSPITQCAYCHGEDGIARLPEPMAVQMRLNASLQNPILTDWKDRFIASYDVELQDFLKAAAQGTASGPTSWDGYVAAITSDACVTAQEREGEAVAITLPVRPALYS